MSEIIDIYDENMTKIGSRKREAVHRDGDWHKVFHCWIIYRDRNRRNMMVLQRRGPHKDIYPNAIETTVAGHYSVGETPENGIREMKEELGIEVSFGDLVPLGVRTNVVKIGDMINREFNDVFLFVSNKDLSEYSFDREELSGLVLVNIDEALELHAGQRNEMRTEALLVDRDSENLDLISTELIVTLDDFVKRKDQYLYKALILAKRYLNGEQHLLI